jgi:hypothetical protein
VEILKQRQERGMLNAFDGPYLSFLRRCEDNYSTNIYRIALPTAKGMYGDNQVVVNRKLADFARQVIARRKARYLLWVASGPPRAAAKVLAFGWINWILLPLAAAAALLGIGRVRSASSRGRLSAALAWAAALPGVVWALGWLAVLFFCFMVALFCVSGTYMDSRIVVPAGVFLAPLLALIILHELTLRRFGASTCSAS